MSDKNVLASIFTSVLCSSSESLLVHSAIGKRLTFKLCLLSVSLADKTIFL